MHKFGPMDGSASESFSRSYGLSSPAHEPSAKASSAASKLLIKIWMSGASVTVGAWRC